MPAPGGYELCARIKRDPRTSRVPVVLLVGAFEPFDEAEARSCGADEVLTKPFQSIRDLVNKVGGLLGGQPETRPDDDARADREDRAKTEVTTKVMNEAASEERPRVAAPAEHVAPIADTVPDSHDQQPVIDLTTASPRTAPRTETARAYPDYDIDDANIETVPADAFAARQPAPDAEVFTADAGEQFDARDVVIEEPAHDARGFEARAAAAAEADDTLLELGDIDSPPASRAAAPADDDFVLDFDEDAHTFAPTPVAFSSLGAQTFQSEQTFPESSYAEPHDEPSSYAGSHDEMSSYAAPSLDEPSLYEDAPSAVEMQSAGSVSIAEPSVAWDAAQEFSVSPSAVTEPVISPTWQEPELRETTADDARLQSAVNLADTRSAVDLGDKHGDDTQPASPIVAQSPTPTGAQFSPEAVEAIAQRVVELLSDRVVREIAWEVVPDLAERIIRQRLEEERARQ
jgi:hypothetical protein